LKSIRFPKMFEGNSTKIVTNKEASTQNLKLLLCSEKGEMLGDSSFGVNIRKFFFEQNSYITEDLIRDEIYTAIKFFAPQIVVDRRDIEIIRDKSKLLARIKGINQLDYTTDLYELVLFQEEER